MYIISENDNLLERLKLLIQSSPLGDEQQPNSPKNSSGSDSESDVEVSAFTATLMENRIVCGPGEKFIILVGREWNRQVTDTVADVARHIMSMDNNGRILVIKKDLANGDQQELRILIENVHEEWRSEWTYQFEKTRKLGDSAARREWIKKIDKWTSPTPPQFSIVDFDDQLLTQKIQSYFEIPMLMKITDWSPVENAKLFTKPPALHWTNYPREAEIQVSFKFTFPSGTLFESLIRELTSESKNYRKWEYDYEWTNGILLREDLVKTTIVRSDHHVLEISGRIDKDEVADEDSSTPFRSVWPYLSKVLRVVVDTLDNYPSLPYTMNVVFIGEIFFETAKQTEETKLNARSLDAIQTFGALERVHSVRFKVGENIYSLNLKQAFPGFEPHTIQDFWLMTPDEAKTKTLNFPPSPKITTQDSPFQPHSNSQLTGSSGTHLNVAKNKGRRVSFGAIKAIPNSGTLLPRTGSGGGFEPPQEVDSHQLHAPDVSPSHSGGEEDDHSTRSSNSKSRDTLSDYVENIVQKTIDEVLVLE
uniref:Uncharacterized protein n=1 Tax=Panagrolaimus sp. JU765 TaxID=591449 RepID=A0AC34Q6Q4_9BILA